MKTTRFLTLFAATAVAATITACGGSDGDGSIPEGLWFGSVAGSSGYLVVLEDGETWGMSEYGALHGWTTGEGNGAFSGTALDFEFSGEVYDVTYTGSFTEKGELEATANTGSGTQEIFGEYDSFYDKSPISLESLAGRYDGDGITRLTGGAISISIDITPDGMINMVPDRGCEATGRVAPRSTGKNIFDVSMTFIGATCSLGNGTTVSGIGLADGEFLKAMAFNSSENDGFVYLAKKSYSY